MTAKFDKKQILKKLSEIIDPELGINIVDLGLIYEIKKTLNYVEVKMTFTSIGCPFVGFFATQVEQKIKEIKGVKDVHVRIVWEPPWNQNMIAKKTKRILGIQ